MSASREKKRRQEFLAANGGIDPKAVREAERKSAEKKSKILYTGIAIAFVIVAAALLIFNSGIVQRSRAAVVIDGEKYSAADVSYYYNNVYQTFMNNGYGSYFINTNEPLSSQSYFGDENKTWADYFEEEAVTTMKLVHAAVKAAKAEGMTLDAEDNTTLKESIDNMKDQAAQNGYSYSAYLSAIYGSLMTPAIYEENLERSLLASKYTTAYYDSLSFTDDEIAAHYEANKKTYDIVDGAYVSISGSAPSTKDADGNSVAPTDEEKAAALEAAKNIADTILDAYKNGGNLESLADEHSATYTGAADLTYTSGTAGDWLFDDNRTAGDCDVLFNESTSTYYVVVFNSRERDASLDYNVRHILISEASLELAEGEETTTDMIVARAQQILDSWDGTEEGFADLAEQYTEDTGSASNGGLYENVMKGNMVEGFENWCYAEGRKAGDTGIVESPYGQHIMYFVGYGSNEYWHSACNADLVNEEYTEWETALADSVTAEIKGGMSALR